MKLAIALLFILACRAACLAQATETTGCIGSRKLRFKAQAVAKEGKFTVKGPADYLAVTEVYPDTPEEVVYKYRISGSGIGSYERSFRSQGFGPVTYFLRVVGGKLGTVRITNHSNGTKSRPVLISGLRPIKAAELKSLLEWDRFTIMGLLPDGTPAERDALLAELAKGFAPRPQDHIGVGFSSEIHYAKIDKAGVKAQIAGCLELAKKHRLPALLGLVSWWSGTPLGVDDGQGGKFGDTKYQQVCYSPDSEVPENPELKALLGDRYSRHYSLSTPNQWSNTPWLTMNSPVLNQYRAKRIDEAIGLLKEASSGDDTWIKGIFLENEPRYWDGLCDDPKSGRNGPLWADFNPLVVEAAKKDNIDLDPADGLSVAELGWLHRNVSRYNQETADALAKAVSSHGFAQRVPVYTHSLVRRDVFPGGAINHSASEWGCVTGARTGLEGGCIQPSDLCRALEWGPWGNVNREENDGRDIAHHLWDLRVSYVLGADLYNSYNWHAIGAQRFFDYVKEFLTEFPVISAAPAEARYVDRGSLKIKAPASLQGFSRIEIPVKVTRKVTGAAFLGLVFDDGRGCSSQQQQVSLAPGTRTLAIDFPTPLECPCGREALIVLYVFDTKGKLAMNFVGFTPESTAGVKLILDLPTQRALSLSVTTRQR